MNGHGREDHLLGHPGSRPPVGIGRLIGRQVRAGSDQSVPGPGGVSAVHDVEGVGYPALRGTPNGTWSGEKGFVGGTQDPAVLPLTQLGAREYDPAIGRFVSVDPLFDPADPQSWNGYAYADNSPVTLSDPDGQMIPCDGGCPNRSKGDEPEPACAVGKCGGVPGHSGDQPGQQAGRPSYPPEFHPAPPNVDRTWKQQAYRTLLLNMMSRGDRNYNQGRTAFCAEFPDDDICTGRSGAPTIHTVLDTFGMAPGIGDWADFLNGLYYAAQGDKTNAAISFTGLIPGIGEAAVGGRLGVKGTKALKAVNVRCNSFVPGTKVLLADGTYKPIEKIKVGDKVLATDPTTGKTQAKKVTAAFSGTSYDHLVQITVDTDGDRGHNTGVITATEHHLFWNPLLRTWTRADQLTPGQQRLQAASVGAVGITDVVVVTAHPRVHDLTVAGIHTFYVEAGGRPVLVHNADGCINWSWKSVKTFGHTFSEHGAGVKNTQSLLGRARSTGNAQGQWLDNEAAAEFLRGVHVSDSGVFGVRLPDGLGQVVMPDGSIRSAPYAYVVPNSRGVIRTAYPTLGEP